jgi:hypothetical protein
VVLAPEPNAQLSTGACRILRAVERHDTGLTLSGPRSVAEDFDDSVHELRQKGRARLVAGVDGLSVVRPVDRP